MTNTQVASLVNKVLEHTRDVLRKLEAIYPHDVTLIRVLRGNEQALLSTPVDIPRLKGNRLGIYQMIEKPSNPTEEEILKLDLEIYELLKALQDQEAQG